MGTNSATVVDLQKTKMIDALEANFGNVTKAAKAAKITPRTHYRWLKEDRQYAGQSENIRDISFRKIRDKLLEKALWKIEQGDSKVLNRMLGIYFKYLPDEIRIANRANDVPIVATVKWITTPQDPKREGYVKPPE